MDQDRGCLASEGHGAHRPKDGFTLHPLRCGLADEHGAWLSMAR